MSRVNNISVDTKMPYVSFVVTSRNDEYSDRALFHMQLFVNSLIAQINSYRIASELIIVEWNPPPDRPYLEQVLKWPKRTGSCLVRIIKVSPELHRHFRNSEIVPMFQMIAKNVGIRRARAPFVLATNIDILFSNELMEFLASGGLHLNRMYRVDRYDVRNDIPNHGTIDERLNWCRSNVIRVYRYLETVNVRNSMIPPPPSFYTTLKKRIVDWLARREHPLHTNACGDFTLLSAKYWKMIGGYPEFPLHAMKLDGLLCYAAHYAGAKENVLKDPMRIYHLDHPARSDGALIAMSTRNSENLGLQISLPQYRAWIEQMRNSHKPIMFNKWNWGLADEILQETIID